MGESHAESVSLLRLCQLVSPVLPVGAYNFSQGLEYAVEKGWVRDEASATSWIGGVASHAVATLDVPLLLRMHAAWRAHQPDEARRWSAYLVASRETQELRAEERHLGKSLAKVLTTLGMDEAKAWCRDDDASYACLFSMAAVNWSIDASRAAQGYLWAWCENQVMAALKLLPIGQSAGQRILNELLPGLPLLVEQAQQLHDEDIGIATLVQGMASAWHETQYSRLFRS